MLLDNLMLKTDSYKLTHYNQYPKDTTAVYSYFESRKGAKYDFTVFFGLQYLIKRYLEGNVVTEDKIDEAEWLVDAHMGPGIFNRKGWERIMKQHDGYLPLKIKALPEGTIVPVGTPMMTVENTDPACYWLTNYVETLLTHVWYSSTVATLSKATKNMMESFLGKNGDIANIDFMLHDFGYRGATTDEAAAIGGAGHLINFKGTDTIAAMSLLVDYYDADISDLAFSVPATEHSIMTSLGKNGEFDILDDLIKNYPTGILSVVADSYDIYKFTYAVTDRKDDILNRNGRFVLRPDSITPTHKSEGELLIWILNELWDGFGGTVNSKGYKVLDDHIRVLWGDGLDSYGIQRILSVLDDNEYSADNMVFGMGGGLLQKVNRDTQRFAFKSSAQERGDVWYDVSKRPLDASKASKAGRLAVMPGFKTVRQDLNTEDILETVFIDGELTKNINFERIRINAN